MPKSARSLGTIRNALVLLSPETLPDHTPPVWVALRSGTSLRSSSTPQTRSAESRYIYLSMCRVRTAPTPRRNRSLPQSAF
jgi:hypothetical protein